MHGLSYFLHSTDWVLFSIWCWVCRCTNGSVRDPGGYADFHRGLHRGYRKLLRALSECQGWSLCKVAIAWCLKYEAQDDMETSECWWSTMEHPLRKAAVKPARERGYACRRWTGRATQGRGSPDATTKAQDARQSCTVCLPHGFIFFALIYPFLAGIPLISFEMFMFILCHCIFEYIICFIISQRLTVK